MSCDKSLNCNGTRIAIVPGSFDPMTVGHLDIISRAAKLFDLVVVAIMINPDKADKAMFSFEEKKKIAELTCLGVENVTVITSDGMLWELAQSLGACAIVKGIRNESDFAYEREMAVYNHEHYPLAQTLYLQSYGEMSHISSSLVREKILSGELLSDMLAPKANEYIASLLAERSSKSEE